MTFENSPLDPGAGTQQRLGWMLRILREAHRESVRVLAEALDASVQSISNWEHTGKIKVEIVRELDLRWNTAGLLERFWYEAQDDQKPRHFGEFARYERTATAMRIFGAMWIPGLIQTPEYARAAFVAYKVADVEDALKRRLERQEALSRTPPPRVWITLDEGVLERPVGGADTMRDQLARLMALGEMPHVTLRFVPKNIGGYLGLDGSFHLMSAAGRTVAYVYAPGGGFLVQDGAQIEMFMNRWEDISERALTWDTSKEIITKAMEGYT